MCLAPCFAGCTKQEYDAEVGRLLETLETAGTELTAKFEREREAASEALDFERAAAFHKQLEKISDALRGLPELARRIEDLDAVILERAAEDKTIAVFPFHAGILAEPCFLDFAELSSQPRSVEAILRESLEPQTDTDKHRSTRIAQPEYRSGETGGREHPSTDWRGHYGLRAAPAELTEHLSLVARWFFSKPREGEIVFREGDWPYRRILRACKRLFAPPVPPTGEARKPSA